MSPVPPSGSWLTPEGRIESMANAIQVVANDREIILQVDSGGEIRFTSDLVRKRSNLPQLLDALPCPLAQAVEIIEKLTPEGAEIG